MLLSLCVAAELNEVARRRAGGFGGVGGPARALWDAGRVISNPCVRCEVYAFKLGHALHECIEGFRLGLESMLGKAREYQAGEALGRGSARIRVSTLACLAVNVTWSVKNHNTHPNLVLLPFH